MSSFHHMEQPDQVAVLDGYGRLTGEYWHPGWLTFIGIADLDHDGKPEVLVAGINNGDHASTLIAFDPDRVGGTAATPSDPRFGFKSLARGTERAVVLFPRTCVSRIGPKRRSYNAVERLTVTPARLYVLVFEHAGEIPPDGVLYELDYNLKVRAVEPALDFRRTHAEMERAGILNHPLSPEDIDDMANRVIVRRGPAVQSASLKRSFEP